MSVYQRVSLTKKTRTTCRGQLEPVAETSSKLQCGSVGFGGGRSDWAVLMVSRESGAPPVISWFIATIKYIKIL